MVWYLLSCSPQACFPGVQFCYLLVFAFAVLFFLFLFFVFVVLCAPSCWCLGVFVFDAPNSCAFLFSGGARGLEFGWCFLGFYIESHMPERRESASMNFPKLEIDWVLRAAPGKVPLQNPEKHLAGRASQQKPGLISGRAGIPGAQC